MIFAFTGEASILQNSCLENKTIPAIKRNIRAEIQNVNWRQISLMKLPCFTLMFSEKRFVFKGNHTSLYKIMVHVLFSCFTHMKGHVAYMQF